MSAVVNHRGARIPAWRLAAYGATGLPLAMAALPIYVHVPKFYADVMGLNLAAIGGLLLAARIFDAIQDPLLGYWSDRARGHRLGRMLWSPSAHRCWPSACSGYFARRRGMRTR